METTYPHATQRGSNYPGKFFLERNPAKGVVLHSAEGYKDGIISRIDGPDVSWHFTVMQDGSVLQHYSLTHCCWHAGNYMANTNLIGIEHEGVAGEALTPAQKDASIALVRWIAQVAGWKEIAKGKTLFEHNQFFATACPSGRIPFEEYSSPTWSANSPVTLAEMSQLTQALVYNVGTERVDLVSHGSSPAREGWMRLIVDYKP